MEVEPLQTSLLGVGPPTADPQAVVRRTWLDERSWVDVARTWLQGGDTLLVELVESVAWQQGRRWMYDRMVDDPRLTSFGRRSKPADAPGAHRSPRARSNRGTECR